MSPPSQHGVRPPVHLLPPEILSIIFLLVVGDADDGDEYRVLLMLVCRRWYAIMLSTPGVPYWLWIENSTSVEMVQAVIQRTRWLLYVAIALDGESIGEDFHEGALVAVIGAASRWQCLWIYSLPRPGKCKAFQIVQPLKTLEFFNVGPDCDPGGFFEPLMTAIATTATPHLTNISLENVNAVLYLAQPDCLRVFCSLTRLVIWLFKRMENPANILPHLHRLEEFSAQYLYLPIYPPDASLPLIQTLRSLQLKSVSVQWMAGKVFPVLQQCKVTFPHQIDTICLQPVTMPACTNLTYNSNDLAPLRYFKSLPLAEFTVKSGQWNVTRGNLQLIAIGHMVVPCGQSLTKLDLQVRCSGQLLIYMLNLLPALEALQLRLDSPRALNETFFEAFIATESNADGPGEIGAMPRLLFCSQLAELNVKYKRWLRGSERTVLLQVFSEIVSSRSSEEDFQLLLSFEGLRMDWAVRTEVESIGEVKDGDSLELGISTPHGIIPLVSSAPYCVMEVPFKEAEYLVAGCQISIACLLTLHHLVELRVGGEKDILPSAPSNLPLFHTLKVLEARKIHHSFLAGQTFHKLERCRMSLHGEGPKLSEDQGTQMPVCTRLDVDDLNLLATLKLPEICELAASFENPEFSMIWGTHIVVNANLSGLELLHVYRWHQQADLIQALRCLPALKSLVIGNGSGLHEGFFWEFVPIHQNWLSTLMMSHYEGRISLLCPMLRSLLIEGFDPTEQRELVPVLKEVVILRAVHGYPLERFTFSSIELGRKRELIGSHGGFLAEMDSLDEGTKPFRLDI